MAKKVATTNMQNDIVDINLSAIRKKRFRIDGDDNRILELNTSDLGVLSRIKEAYPKLQELNERAIQDWPNSDADHVGEKDYEAVVNVLKGIDTEMRQLIDYIFNSNVSEVCAPDGTMYDPIDGQFRFEHIINCLVALYENNIDLEVKQISNRVRKYTDKYTGK